MIDTEEIKGTLYFSKNGEGVPDEIIIELKTHAENKAKSFRS